MTKVSNTGYKKDSKDKNEKSLIIPSGHITMDNVQGPVFGQDNLGNSKIMYPNKDYYFPGNYVVEHPMFQLGGENGGHAQVENSPPILDRIELMKWGKYIDNPKRREQHMKDVYWNIIGDGYDPKTGYDMMKEMGAYGSENRGDIAKSAAVWGWDTKDVKEDQLKKWAIEYDDALESGVSSNKKQGGEMKKPDNKGFKNLPKKVQETILNHMSKQFGGENLARPIWTMQAGGAINDDVYSAAGYMPADNPYLQNGGQPKFTPEQWNKFNMDQGLKASPGYSATMVNKNKSYLEFYDPNKFQPVPGEAGSIGWNKIGDPSYKYTSEQNSPFIKYTPPPAQNNFPTQKTYIENDPNRKPYQFGPNQNYDPNTGNYFTGPAPLSDNSNIIKPLTREMGGPLGKFVTNYEKQFGGAHGNIKLQGQSMDEFLQKRTTDFVDYLANNTKNFMYKDEAKNFMQMGGPFGQPSNDVPDYVQGMTDQYNFPTQQFSPPVPYQFGMTQNGIDPNQVSYDVDMQNRLRELSSVHNKQRNHFSNNNIADLGMMGAQTINGFFNKAQNYKQQQFLNQKQAISNTSPATYGNKGQYDINQGNFRPNQMTPSFKRGGSYELDKKTIDDLISQGYDIEFLD